MEKLSVKTNAPKLSEKQFNLFAYSLSRIVKKFYDNPSNMRKYIEWKSKKEVESR